MIVTLRKMTRKSVIGFGYHRDLRVQDLINLMKHSELIKMYYMLDRIDFDEEVKKELRITPDRVIPKPGKNYDMYGDNIRQMIFEIQQSSPLTMEEIAIYKWKQNRGEQIRQSVASKVSMIKGMSRIHNRNRNQKS